MTTKKKIEQLEKEIAELKAKVAALEARPFIITIPPMVEIPYNPLYPIYPGPMVSPWPPYPQYTYSGTPTPMCQAQQNVSASMSNQESRLIQ